MLHRFRPNHSLMLTMAKVFAKSSKVTTATLPSLKQARLVGINDHVKSVRQKPATSYSNPTPGELKQLGLTAFGFSAGRDRTNAIEKPSPKRRKKLAADFEIPETQFALNTQSPELPGFDPLAASGRAISEEYPSPSPEVPSPSPSPSPISPPIAMPPLAIPVTPKRRRVTEVPDSRSPPVTPFTPYASQKQNNRPDSQSSPTAHKGISPIIQSTEGCLGSYSSTPKPTQVLQQRLFASIPRIVRQKDGDDKIEMHKGSEKVEGMGEVAEGAGTMFGDEDKIIKSSQWWENEDAQNLLPSTQITQQDTSSQGHIKHDTVVQESRIRLVQDEKLFHLGPSHKIDHLAENADGRCEAYGSQADRAMGQEGNDIQESFRSMTCPTLEFRGDTPDPQPIMDYDQAPTNENLPSPTTIQRDSEDVENYIESQEYPVYGAYQTQQFPSSFYQHNNYRFSSPEIPPSSQVVPGVDNELYFAGKVDCRSQERSQFLPGVIEMEPDAGDEWNDRHDKEGPSQLLSSLFNWPDDEAGTRDDLQSLPVLINESDVMVRRGVDGGDKEDEQDIQNISIKDENFGGEERGKIGWRDGTVTRSQLLPSELMETFPMPPPLSQFSSYGPYCYEYGERETQ